VFDVPTGTWSSLEPPMSVGRKDHVVVPYDDKLYVFGGQAGEVSLSSALILSAPVATGNEFCSVFDLQTQTYSQGPLPSCLYESGLNWALGLSTSA